MKVYTVQSITINNNYKNRYSLDIFATLELAKAAFEEEAKNIRNEYEDMAQENPEWVNTEELLFDKGDDFCSCECHNEDYDFDRTVYLRAVEVIDR